MSPYFADLREIGARVLVLIEIYTTRLGDKPRNVKLCGLNHDSTGLTAPCNPRQGTVVESRNVTFLATLPSSADGGTRRPPQGLKPYARDVIAHSSFLNLTAFDTQAAAAAAQLARLHARIRDMPR